MEPSAGRERESVRERDRESDGGRERENARVRQSERGV